MTDSVRVRFEVVDRLPHGAPCAVAGEPDNLTYLLSREASTDAIAAGLTRLYARLTEQVDYAVGSTRCTA